LKVRLLAAAALAWILASPPGLAQSRDEYFALIDRYASGETTEAVAAVAAWPKAGLRAVVESLPAQTSPTLMRRAVMLHTEAAFVEEDDGRESFQLEVARSFVAGLLRSPYAELTVRDFAGRWHALAAILYCMRNNEARARTEVNRGLSLDPDHRYVNLLAGALLEFRLGQDEPNPRGSWNVFAQSEYRLKKQLHQAAQIYRGIISRNPEFYEARLRLGWVLTLNDSLDNAREQLELVAARAPTHSDLSYIAHMFLGSLHERAKRPAEAVRAYEGAHTASPYQSSLVALMRIAAARSERERVRSFAGEISESADDDEEDPWSYYPLCATGTDLLDGLRAEAQRP
jgi:tetratricopeptide (TPR) repeat protein